MTLPERNVLKNRASLLKKFYDVELFHDSVFHAADDKQIKLEIVKKVCAALGLGELTPEIHIDKSIVTVDDEIQ